MNGIERITARLMEDARAEIDALNAETEAQCAAIMAEAEVRANEAYDKHMAEGKAELSRRSERSAAAADMEARKSTLAFKQEMVSEAFAQAIEAVVNLPKSEYIAFLAAMAAEAAVKGDEEIVLNARDKAEVGEALIKEANALLKSRGRTDALRLAVDTAEIAGGFVLRGGNIEVNCAVETLVQLHRAALSSQVAEILFK